MWTAVAPMSISRDAVGVCLLGDRLYAVGGYDGQVYLSTVEAYDPQTNEWTQVHTQIRINTKCITKLLSKHSRSLFLFQRLLCARFDCYVKMCSPLCKCCPCRCSSRR